jgi:hypothetical protein
VKSFIIKIGIFLIINSTLLQISVPINAQKDDEGKILFLHLKMKDNTITLEKSTIRSGIVKQKKGVEKKGEIYYELLSSSNSLLWNGEMEDPIVKRFEYEDPDNPGQLKLKVVHLNEAYFTLRVPFKKEINHITFYKRESSIYKSNNSTSTLKQIGIIELKLKNNDIK